MLFKALPSREGGAGGGTGGGVLGAYFRIQVRGIERGQKTKPKNL